MMISNKPVLLERPMPKDHGDHVEAVDLPRGRRETVEEVHGHTCHTLDEVSAGGGFIRTPCHTFRPSPAIASVVAVQGSVAERRDQGVG